ncbi:hypothetical protein D3C81_1028860 [compost metagenome]
MYRFFKHNDQWRYKERTWPAAKPIDTFALERILGVIGGPKVIVVRTWPGEPYDTHITVENGFITHVAYNYEYVGDAGCAECCPVTYDTVERSERTEFFATEIPL